MPIRVYLLQAPYAIAAGTTIRQNVAQYGKLPAAIQDEFDRWLADHTALDTAVAVDARTHELDPPLDRAISAPANVCDAILAAYADPSVTLDAKQLQQQADAALIRGIFHADLGRLVNLPYTEEWAAVRQLLQRATSDQEVAAAAERLSLGPLLALAATLHDAYGRSLGVSVASPTRADDTRLASWNSSFADLIVAARYLEKKHAGLYEVFAAPYEEQIARQQSSKPAAKKKTPA